MGLVFGDGLDACSFAFLVLHRRVQAAGSTYLQAFTNQRKDGANFIYFEYSHAILSCAGTEYIIFFTLIIFSISDGHVLVASAPSDACY